MKDNELTERLVKLGEEEGFETVITELANALLIIGKKAGYNIVIKSDLINVAIEEDVRVINSGDVCECEDCEQSAEEMVFSRDLDKVMKLCFRHGDIVIDEGNPEYFDRCDNCKCRLPVN